MNTPHKPFVHKEGVNWTSVIAFSIFHAGAVAALFFFTWPAFFAFLAFYWISLSFGIGMGYHRLQTHRSYDLPKAINIFWPFAARSRLRAVPSPGSLHIGSTTSFQTRKAIRTRRETASGGRTSSGC